MTLNAFVQAWGPLFGMLMVGLAGFTWGWDRGFKAGARASEEAMRAASDALEIARQGKSMHGQVCTPVHTSREREGN